MMEIEKIYFDKIFDFNVTRAKKMYNSSYLEDLTGLFEAVSMRIDEGREYFFEDQYYLKNPKLEPNTSYSDFIDAFKNSFFNGSNGRIHIIRGRAGVGKTLFFTKGIQKLLRNNTEHQDKYIPLCVDFKNIDSKQSIKFYSDSIYETLNKKAIDAIRMLGGSFFNEFITEYNVFKGPFDDFKTVHNSLFPVWFFCKKIYNKYEKPCIIVFDNIDLSCAETQRNVFKATVNVCEELNKFMSIYKFENYCIYFAMRPETYLSRHEARLGEVINFPLPNILKISLQTIKKNLLIISEEFDKNDELKCEVEYYNIINEQRESAKTFKDVALYFNSILTYYLENFWERNDLVIKRLGTNEDFHCNISNYNVRTFLNFLSDTLSNGGFKPLTKDFNKSTNGHYYSVFEYIEMIIRGRWLVHPGNKFIESEGGNKAPIIFNMFDTNLWTNTQENKIRHFMLYIRILQFFCLCSNEEKVFYCDLENILCNFFDKEHIKNAIKKLIHVRIIYSFSQGDVNIASLTYWKEVSVEENTEMQISPTGIFYLQNLICEFEYLYQMALSSLMPQIFTNELLKIWNTEKELTVLYFLKGILLILKENIESYNEEIKEKFILTFCQDNDVCQPFRRMLRSFIVVMEHKVQRAEKLESNRLEKLKDILNQSHELESEAENYFSQKLGGFICL